MSVETLHNSLEINSMFDNICPKGEYLTKDTKAEKCRIIRELNYNTYYSRLYPESYKTIIYTDTPMLCLRMKQLELSEQIDLWKSDEYIADEKIDGIRCYIAYNKDYENNNGYEFFSRENNEDTLLPKNITNIVNVYIQKPELFYKSFLLDCEVELKENSILIHVFDCLSFNDNIIINEPWYFRRYISEKITESINSQFVVTTKYVKYKKIDFYDFIKRKGGEGVVIKNINSKYSSKGTRSKYGWTKVKGNLFDYSIIEDTLEGYISDPVIYNDENITLSAFINNDELSQKIALIPSVMFNYLSNNMFSTKKPQLGTVVEFSSSFYSNKCNLFMNTYPIKIRTDKTIKDCFYSKKDIERWSA